VQRAATATERRPPPAAAAPPHADAPRPPARAVLGLQRSAGNRATAAVLARAPKTKAARGAKKTMRYRLKVAHTLSAAAFKEEFLRQYYSLTTEAEVARKRPLWSEPQRGTTDAEVKQGFAFINLTLTNQTDFDELSQEDRKAVDDETDRRFYEKTGIAPGTKIKAGDKKMAEVWTGTRNAVLAEDNQRKQLAALPGDIKAIMFAGGADADTLAPEDYTQAQRIAAKLANLPPELRKDYQERINASTSSLDALEASIDGYLAFRADRDQQDAEHEEAAGALLGAEDLYSIYRSYRSLQQTAAFQKAARGAASDKAQAQESIDYVQDLLAQAEKKLDAALKANKFDTLADFETALERYRFAFRAQATDLALDVLARYEHTLFEERKKLAAGGATAIAQGVAGSRAKELYATARSKESEAMTVRLGIDPMEKGPNKARQYRQITQLQAQATSARAAAEAEVVKGSGDDKIVAERGVDREKIANLDAAGVQAYLLSVIAERERDIATARAELKEKPNRIFKLPDLVAATKKLQSIEKGTIYNSIVDDYIAEEPAKHILSAIAIGIVAIALAVLVPGGGWLAAAALVGSAGLSSYQAYVAYNEYVEESRDYRLHFIQSEPSLIWVGIAIAAAALDIGVAAAAVWKASAPALKALEGPMMQFAKDGDAAALLAKIEAADGLDLKVKAAMTRELKLAEAEDAAVAAFAQSNARVNAMGILDPALAKLSFRAVFAGWRRGINTITKLRADAKLMKLMTEVTGVTGASRKELEIAFKEVKTLANAGQLRKMDDATLLSYVDRWAINRSIPGYGERLLDEMKFWKPLSAQQQKALGALEQAKSTVSGLYAEKNELLAERESLLAQRRNKATASEETRERLLEINEHLGELDPSFKQATVRKRVVYYENGERVEKLVDEPIKHPPGKIERAEGALDVAEKEAAAAELTLYDRLRAAAPSVAARERALKNVVADQVGVLKTKPTGKLQADHVVSVREIADMDGFAELTWKQQKTIVDMKQNLVAMDSSANASKGDRSWRAWKSAAHFYEQPAIDKMLVEEARVRKLIRDAIDAARPPVKPVP
jgi:hypothetical protein